MGTLAGDPEGDLARAGDVSYLEEIRSIIEGQRSSGALPGISIHDLTAPQIAMVYAALRMKSRCEFGEQTFWDRELSQHRPLGEVPAAAELVIHGRADSFHHCLHAIEAGGVELPPLGVFVFEDQIELDYDPNDSWGWNEVAGLLELLLEIAEIAPGARFSLDDEVTRDDTERFATAWVAFRRMRHPT